MNRSRSRGRHLGPLLLVSVSIAACVTTSEADRSSPPPLSQPPLRQTAAQETQTVVEAVQKSGDVPPDIQPILFRAAEAAFVETFGNPDPALARIERGGCFAGGCLFFVTFPDRCAELAFKQRFSEVAHTRLHSWPGPVYRSPAIKAPDGRIHQTWALLLAETPDRRARLETLLHPARPPVGAIRLDVCASINPAPKDNPAPQGVK